MKLFLLFIFISTTSLVFAQEKGTGAVEYKNQNKSSFIWGEVPAQEFLSFKKWKVERHVKDETPEWEQAFRARKNREVAGRFFQCVGTCHVERGEGYFFPNFRSPIYENDEIQTIGESYAWIFLLDGTMVRLSPESSITINELNLGQNENFLNARINVGNVLWMSRLENLHVENNYRETEALFFPLALYDANPVIDQKPYREGELILLTEAKETTLHQVERLNQLIEENNGLTKGKKTFAFLTLPNVTLMGYAPVIEILSFLGGKSYFKKRTFEDQELKMGSEDKESELQYQLRGYENKELVSLESNDWMEVDEKGRTVAAASDINLFRMGEFITKRIPSILVARELLLQRYSHFMFQEKYDRIALAKNEGYRLWEKSEIDLRIDFIKEYSRRIETTNLLSSTHFMERMKARGYMTKVTEHNLFFKKALEKLSLFDPYFAGQESGEQLNSTSKMLWKMMYGIK